MCVGIIVQEKQQSERAQAFPGATSMAYADNISEKEKIIIPSKNGLFVTPEGGVVQTKTNISCSQRKRS